MVGGNGLRGSNVSYQDSSYCESFLNFLLSIVGWQVMYNQYVIHLRRTHLWDLALHHRNVWAHEILLGDALIRVEPSKHLFVATDG